MKATTRHGHSLFRKIFVPLLAVILLLSFTFYCATLYGGVAETLRRNAEDVLTERVSTQRNALETLFTTRWSNFSLYAAGVRRVYDEVLAASGRPLYEDAGLQRRMLEASAPTLISMLRGTGVTGVFLVLNDGEAYAPRAAGEAQDKYGLCIRDYDPASDYTDMEDLMLVRCPAALTRTIGCSMEAWWEALFTFDDLTPGNYYYNPLRLAYENPGADAFDLAYFDGAHNFGQADRMVVSYSVPLMDDDGYPYAVLGVELTADYLKTLLPATTLYGSGDGCYALVRHEEGKTDYDVVAFSGVLFQQCFGSLPNFTADVNERGILECSGVYMVTPLRGALNDLQIYNHNTPYEHEKLALVGLVKTNSLYAVNAKVQGSIAAASALVMVAGSLLVLLACKKLTRPINRLSERARKADGTESTRLERLRIDEIDDLVESIESLNDKVNRAQTRTEFFSRMSHDMRTPMNAIIGFSSPEMLENADENRLRDYLSKINTSGSYLLALINDVLDMTKIESQRMELREEPLNVQDVVNDVVPMIQEVADGRSVRLTVDCASSIAAFYGDRQRMGQILMNLLSNAVKFTPGGKAVRLRVREATRDEQTVTHEIIVEDEGCGMSAAFQTKMYEPFSQAATSEGGSGLGLAITKQLVTLMGGTIDCDSSPGQGTRFTVLLTSRLTKLENALKQTPGEDGGADGASLEGKRVLLCEDHPLNALIARRLLERRGLAVEEAANGRLGVERFQRSPEGYYDLILMDIRMPEMDGLAATRAIRALPRKDAAGVPIIAMTANAFTEDVEASHAAGMNVHLSKPIDPKILYVTLNKYLREKKE